MQTSIGPVAKRNALRLKAYAARWCLRSSRRANGSAGRSGWKSRSRSGSSGLTFHRLTARPASDDNGPMRRWVAPTAVAALIGALGLAGSAGAGVTYDFAFRSTDIAGNAIDGAVSGGGHTFTFFGTTAAHACNTVTNAGCVVLDVILRTTTPLFSASVSVRFDNDNGLFAGFAQAGYSWARAR